MGRIKVNERIEKDVHERLIRCQSDLKLSLSDLISNALDALEREQKLPETICERVENIEMTLAELLTRFDERMDQAGINEKERLKSLLQLLESRMQAHDQAEQERFNRISASRIF